MDLFAPLIHEFTYQSMVHDLLRIKEGDKVTYKMVLNKGSMNEEEKEMELNDHDRVWVEYRHMHMKDVLGKLGEDFAKFRAANPQFAEGYVPPLLSSWVCRSLCSATTKRMWV